MRIRTKVRFEAARYLATAALALLVALFDFGPSTRQAHAADPPIAQKGNFKAEIIIHFSGHLLVLEEGPRRALLAATDIGSYANDERTPALMERLAAIVGCPRGHVMLNASHTHGGPMLPMPGATWSGTASW